MKKHKGIWVVVGCLVVVFVFTNIFFLFQTKSVDTSPVDMATTTQSVVVPLTVASSTKTVQTKEYGVTFDFPVTNNEEINMHINTFVDTTIDAFIKEVQGFGPLPMMDRQYTMQGWFETYVSEQYNTFVFLVSIDTGGAHPNQFFYTKTFTPSGALVTLEQVLAVMYGDSITLEQVATVASDTLYAQMGEHATFGWIDDGTQPTTTNFADFYIENNEIVFLFEPYAVGPYAWGPSVVRISREAFMTPQDPVVTTSTTTVDDVSSIE